MKDSDMVRTAVDCQALLEACGAENFVVATVEKDGVGYEVSVQKIGGVTTTERINDLEARLEKAGAHIEQLCSSMMEWRGRAFDAEAKAKALVEKVDELEAGIANTIGILKLAKEVATNDA
jgi:hypothetical protein